MERDGRYERQEERPCQKLVVFTERPVFEGIQERVWKKGWSGDHVDLIRFYEKGQKR